MEDEGYDAAAPAAENPTAALVGWARDLLVQSLVEESARRGISPGELPAEVAEELYRQAINASYELEAELASSEEEELVLQNLQNGSL
jgi:hypothetical protein